MPNFAGKWALIGGLILPNETADQSVERHLSDKASIGNIFKEQLYTFSDINRDPRASGFRRLWRWLREMFKIYLNLELKQNGHPRQSSKIGL